MRVLCSVTGSPSHARAMLPFARALGAAGHDVVVVLPPDLARVFDGAPVRVEPAFPPMADAMRYMAPIARSIIESAGDDPETLLARMLPVIFVGPSVTESERALERICPDPPDLVLRDGAEFAALLYAEHHGVPHLPVPSGTSSVLAPEMIAEALDRRRAELGFPAGDDPAPIYRHGRLDCMPPAWSLARPGTPAAMAYRQEDRIARDDTVPDWVAGLRGDRPLVLAAMGTALPLMDDEAPRPVDPAATLRTVLAGVSELDADVVLTTGGIDLGVALGDLPPHVHVERWVAQPLLLQCADLFVAHGGYNGIRESVRAGTPLVVLPQFGDQQHNAERVTALGFGRRSEPDAASIAATCAAVLDDPAVRASARRAQRAMLALPPVEAAVGDLAGLVGRAA